MKSNTSRLYRCTKCKEEFPFEGIRYSTDGKNIVCANCFNKSIKSQKIKEDDSDIHAGKAEDRVKIICMDCRYKFSLKKATKVKLRCPYCGGNMLMKDEITVDKLLEESSKNSFS